MEDRVEASLSRREAGEALRVWRDDLIQGELLPILKQIEQISLGEQGERKVGAALADLERDGYRSVHSLRHFGCDIDHVLVGPGGIFVIETKHRSGCGLLTFRNGQGIFCGKKRWGNTAMKQAKRGALQVRRFVEEECGLSEGVWPIVVFVGDWLVADQWETTDARVFTPESLKNYIREQQPILRRTEIELISTHLERSTIKGVEQSA